VIGSRPYGTLLRGSSEAPYQSPAKLHRIRSDAKPKFVCLLKNEHYRQLILSRNKKLSCRRETARDASCHCRACV